MNNKILQKAKNSKYDEFYTTYETIEGEITYYLKHFENKTVICNCDDPLESNFCKYFLRNFNVLRLKRLICTSFSYSKIAKKPTKKAYKLDICKFSEDEIIGDNCIKELLNKKFVVTELLGNGDFRSEECLKLLNEADIVVTNPPFSLFNEFVMLAIKYEKKFLIIGNQNALTYKDIFPLIKENQIWTGYKFGEMKFRVPQDSEPRKTRFWIDDDGQKWRSIGNAMWLTNLDIEKRHKHLPLTKKYDPNFYPRYDKFDAIDVKCIRDIPIDYKGIMGVPITIINHFNSSQFIIIGEANHGSDNEFDLFKPTINGKEIFKRILIKNKRIEK